MIGSNMIMIRDANDNYDDDCIVLSREIDCSLAVMMEICKYQLHFDLLQIVSQWLNIFKVIVDCCNQENKSNNSGEWLYFFQL